METFGHNNVSKLKPGIQFDKMPNIIKSENNSLDDFKSSSSSSIDGESFKKVNLELYVTKEELEIYKDEIKM